MRVFGMNLGIRVLLIAAAVGLAGAGMARGAGPAAGGVIHVATNAEPGTLDWTASTATATRLVAWHVYETLFALDRNYDVKPLLAEGYSVSADGLHYTIRLRRGVAFHTGQPMTADDVVASLERWGELSGGGRETFTFIKHVTKVDPATIEITLNRVFAPLIDNLGDPKQAAIIMPQSLARAAGAQPARDYIGTGPYAFQKWEQGRQIVLARNPHYAARAEDWGGLTGRKVAYADEIDFLPVRDDQVRFAGVSTGEYDLALELAPDLYPQIKGNPHLTADIVKVFTWRGVVFNKARPPFNDARMRRAVLYAIKPGDLMAAVGPKEFWSLDPALFFPQQDALYTTVGKDVYNHQNLEKARALMKEAGYAGRTIALLATKDYAWNYNLSQVLVPQLQAAGFAVDEQVYDWPTLLSRWGQTSPRDAAGRKALIEQIQATFYTDVPVAKIGNEYGLEVYNDHLRGYTSYFDVRFWNVWVTR